MTAAGYLQDDDMRNVIPVPAPWVHDKQNAGVDFWIADVGDYRRLVDGLE